VRGWFDLLERFGSRSFATLAAEAVAVASDGFTLSAAAAGLIQRSQPLQDAAWRAIYGAAAERANLRQPDLARTLQVLSEEGPDAFYAGRIGGAIAAAVQAEGGLLSLGDLSRHRGHWLAPLCAPYRDVEILELPPPSQGVGVLEALRIIESWGPLPPGNVDRHHLVIEAVKAAQADLRSYVGDPEVMPIDAGDLLTDAWIHSRRGGLRMDTVTQPPRGPASPGGTTYLTAADADGRMISLIQSNYMGFGSGITVEAWGINLHNRGSDFVLDPSAANALGPARYTRHTLSPGLIRKDGRPWACLGTRGGDYQVPIGVQLVTGLVDDRRPPGEALAAHRWIVGPESWTVGIEPGFDEGAAEGLRGRGHVVAGVSSEAVGHAQMIRVDGAGYLAAADPRTESGVDGVPA
jgi:gamma-glutamyltranspeptidase / glutathione hydrolase